MKKIISGVMLLTVSSLVIKILGFVFRIYLTNIIGAEGAGLYQLILSVYALGASVAVSGINIAVSALVGAQPKSSASIVRTAVIISFITGIVSFAVCFFKTDLICSLIGDKRALTPIKIISLCFPFTAIFAALSGYFNGKCDVSYPVIGQITEQAVRIGIILLFVAPAAKKGITDACVVAAFGITAAEAVSAVYLFIMFRSRRPYSQKLCLCPKKIAAFSIPAAISGWAGSLLHTLESVIIPGRFVSYGSNHGEAVAALGIVKGMAMPLLLLPNILITALSTVTLPSVSYAREHDRMFKVKSSVSGLIRICFIVGGLFAVIFFSFGKELCMLLYRNGQAGGILRILGFISPFVYINMISGSVLCGLGKQKLSLFIGIAEGAVRIILMYFLIPAYGLTGCAISMTAGSFLACVFNLRALISSIGSIPCRPGQFAAPPSAVALSCLSVGFFKGLYALLGPVCVYFLALLLFRGIGTEDIGKIRRNVK